MVSNGTRHLCAFFHREEEEYRTLTPIIREALQRGEKAILLIDSADQEKQVERLTKEGDGIATALKSGQLALHEWDRSVLRDGFFVPEEMLALIDRLLSDAAKEGYPRTRLIGYMDRPLENLSSLIFMKYEARLNELLVRHEGAVVLCSYDLNRMDGTMVFDAMRTHPMTLIDGIAQRNPFYTEPAAFLKEMELRRGER